MISLYAHGNEKPCAFTDFNTRLDDFREQWKLYLKHWDKREAAPAPVLTELVNRFIASARLEYSEIPEFIRQFLALDIEKQTTLISLCFELKQPLNTGLKKLFHIWRKMIEKATMLFAAANDIKIDPAELEALSISQGVNTSSPIIYYVYCARPGAPAFDLNGIKFDYIGFCPKEAVLRTRALLRFPVTDLFRSIPVLDLPVIFADIYTKMLLIFGPEPSATKHSAEPVVTATADAIDSVSAYIARLEQIQKIINEKEDFYMDMAKKIDQISYKIEHDILLTFL